MINPTRFCFATYSTGPRMEPMTLQFPPLDQHCGGLVSSLMVDWLTIKIPLVHLTLNAGRVAGFLPDGSEDWSTDLRFKAVGSYSKTLQLRSETDVEILADLRPWSRELWMSGNFLKFITGHNVFGHTDVPGMVIQVIKMLIERKVLVPACYGLLENTFSRIRQGDFELYRIDITDSRDLGTKAAAFDYIDYLAHTTKTTFGRATRKKSTVYWGQGSSYWHMKAYSKWLEIKSKNRAHRLPDQMTTQQREFLYDLCESWVRVELQLNSRKLKDMYLKINQDYGEIVGDTLHLPALKYWQLLEVGSLESIYLEYLRKITMPESINLSEETAVDRLSHAAYKVYSMWKAGRDPFTRMSRTQYYAHRKQIKDKMNVDITIPFEGYKKHDLTVVRTLDVKPVDIQMVRNSYDYTKKPLIIAA